MADVNPVNPKPAKPVAPEKPAEPSKHELLVRDVVARFDKDKDMDLVDKRKAIDEITALVLIQRVAAPSIHARPAEAPVFVNQKGEAVAERKP